MENENEVVENQQVEQEENQKPEFDENAYKQVQEDLYKYKRIAQSQKDQLEQAKREAEEARKETLVKNQEYKKLWEQEQRRAQELSEKYSGLNQAIVEDRKISAIEKLAIKNGIRDEALEDILYHAKNTDDVVVETTSEGRINVLGADRFVENMKEKKRYWFKDSEAPPVNNNSGEFRPSAGNMYSPAELLKLQKENPAEYQKAVLERRIRN